LRFVKRTGLDAFQGIQDVKVGGEVTASLGRAMKGLHQGGKTFPNDIHAQLSIFAGEAWDHWIMNAQVATEARQVFSGPARASGWRDVFAEADLYLYWQPGSQTHQSLFFRVSATGGWSVESPFQLTLGGKDAVRGYREDAFPGGRRFILSFEDRLFFPWPAPELFDFGMTLFTDLGRIVEGDVPFGTGSGWRGSAGAGIRLGFPPGTANILRIDFSLPVSSRTQLNDLILRVHLQELLGILPGMRDLQLLRSLRTGVKPDLITLPW
jgi:hypothetical protein